MKYKSTAMKTLWPARIATSSKDRWIGAYSIGLTVLGKLSCPIEKKTYICVTLTLVVEASKGGLYTEKSLTFLDKTLSM